MEEPILVTGANGFIGRRLVEQLLDEERDTHAFLLKGTALPPEWACRPWLHDLIAALHQGPAIIGHGNLNAGLVYVDNLVGLMIRAAEAPHAVGHTYNAAEDCPTTWRQYVTDIARLAKAPPPRSIPLWAARPAAHLMEAAGKLLHRRQRPQLTREALQLVGSHLDIPIHKARAELNYQPRVSYEQGLAQVEEYWKRHEQSF